MAKSGNGVVMAEWKGTRTTNLVRRDGRQYYAQIKIDGKTYRRSLETEKLDIAKIKLPLVLAEIRSQARASHAGDSSTLGGAITLWQSQQLCRPELKPNTKKYITRCADMLRETLPLQAGVDKFQVSEAQAWWVKIAERFHCTYANNLLSSLKHVLEVQVDAGHRVINPAAKLKRMKIVTEIKKLPTREDFMAVVADIRERGQLHGEESADWVEWMAFTGMRPAEIEALQWEDVGKDAITVRGGEHGTKNRRERIVPIIPALMPIVERRRQLSGPVFYIKKPHNALRNACKRVGVNHIKVYELRHLFATICIESGISFAVTALWLGHSDGGALAAKVYGHVRDTHSMEEAQRVRF